MRVQCLSGAPALQLLAALHSLVRILLAGQLLPAQAAGGV
jgi:hypothetical protein